MGYVISPGCTGPQGEALALSANDDGTITLEDAAEVTIHLVWSLIYDVQSGNFGMISLNSVESGTPMMLGLVDTGGGTSKLQMQSFIGGIGPGMTWDVAAGGPALAVRPTLSTSLNLNVEGAGPYAPGNPVIAYDGWGGGQPNEVWTFTPLGYGDYPWYYALVPDCAGTTMLTANPEDAGGQLTIQAAQGPDYVAGDAQLWAANYYIDGVEPMGVILVNAELQMSLRTTPGGGAVFCADATQIDPWSVWAINPGPDAQMSLVTPIGNSNLELNVSGGGPYDPGNVVITYPWQGGAANEQWQLVPVGHLVT